MDNTFELNGKKYKVLVDRLRISIKGNARELTAGEVEIADDETKAFLVKNGEGVVEELADVKEESADEKE